MITDPWLLRLADEVLAYLTRNVQFGPVTPTSLARMLSRDPSHVVDVLEHLAAEGKIERYSPPPELADHPQPCESLPPRAEWTEPAWQLAGTVQRPPRLSAEEWHARIAAREQAERSVQEQIDAFNREHPVGTCVTWTRTFLAGKIVLSGVVQHPATRYLGFARLMCSLTLDGQPGHPLAPIDEIEKAP